MSQYDYSRGHVAREEDILAGELASLALTVKALSSIGGRFAVAARKARREEKDDDLDQESVEKALHSLDGTVSRFRGASGQLYRVLERRVEDALDPHAARERKGRPIPRVCKSLTAPTEGRAFIEQAAAAGRAGRLDEFVARHGTFERWSENYRRGAASA